MGKTADGFLKEFVAVNLKRFSCIHVNGNMLRIVKIMYMFMVSFNGKYLLLAISSASQKRWPTGALCKKISNCRIFYSVFSVFCIVS